MYALPSLERFGMSASAVIVRRLQIERRNELRRKHVEMIEQRAPGVITVMEAEETRKAS
jgi:hypothetical protein